MKKTFQEWDFYDYTFVVELCYVRELMSVTSVAENKNLLEEDVIAYREAIRNADEEEAKDLLGDVLMEITDEFICDEYGIDEILKIYTEKLSISEAVAKEKMNYNYQIESMLDSDYW